MRLIDADEMISRFKQMEEKTNNIQDCFLLGGIMAVINEQPTADTRPLRKGIWEYNCICSKCGQIDYDMPNYCPNCGAKMKGVEK